MKNESRNFATKLKVANRMTHVYGHTDNIPVAGKYLYQNSWELSSLRAAEVVNYLVSKGVGTGSIAPIGFGEYHPIADNDTKLGRSENRRIELVLTPKLEIKAKEVNQAER